MVLPNQMAVYRSIEGLIQHFELIMTNRQWKPPVDEVYGATESPNGELGFYVVADGSGMAYRARTRPPSFIHFAIFPYLIVGPPAERRGGGAGQPEHHRGGVGSMSVLSRRTAAEDPDVPAALPEQAGGDAAGPAPGAGRAALRAAGGDPRDRRPARPQPGRGPRHDDFYGFFRDEKHPLGKTRLWVCRSLACGLRGGEELLADVCQKLHVKPGGTTADGKITVEFAECIGVCEGAPAVLVNDEAG